MRYRTYRLASNTCHPACREQQGSDCGFVRPAFLSRAKDPNVTWASLPLDWQPSFHPQRVDWIN